METGIVVHHLFEKDRWIDKNAVCNICQKPAFCEIRWCAPNGIVFWTCKDCHLDLQDSLVPPEGTKWIRTLRPYDYRIDNLTDIIKMLKDTLNRLEDLLSN